jgi:23S rRNA (adenine2030-N6)-methyltransferase
MLSYQHAYHAGGPADVHKHMVLADLLALLTRKKRGLAYVETHAGRGLYDLASPEAARTGEAAQGFARLRLDAASPYARAIAYVRERHGPTTYPGSPLIAGHLLRAGDAITLMELHPAEHAALRRAMADTPAALHRRDGYEGALALAPFTPRKGLVLIDPSYEVKSEYLQAAEFILRLVAKWPEAVVLLWYPLLPAARHVEMLAGLQPLSPLIDEVAFRPPPSRGMTGSGLALINAPFGAERVFTDVHPQAAAILAPRPA